MNIRSHALFFIMAIFLMKSSFANNSWNGAGSIISNSSGSRVGYGLTHDISRVHPGSSTSLPVVFFQWELNSSDGNKLRIDAEGYPSATVTYGLWDSSKGEKITHANVSLPFILDPAIDGLSNQNGTWYTIAVSLPFTPTASKNIVAEATNASGTNFNRSPTQEIRLDNANDWGGNGSLISYSSDDKTGYGITRDVAVVKTGLRSSVFFQWEVDSADGKAVEISSFKGCFSQVDVTTGDWDSRANDSTRQVALPYTVNTSKSDGHWVLIRVDLRTASTCDDFVNAKIVKSAGGNPDTGGDTALGGEGFYGARPPSDLIAVNMVHPENGPATTQVTPFIQLQWTDQSNIETGYVVKVYPAGISVPTAAQTYSFDRPAMAGTGSRGAANIADLPVGTYSFQVCPEGSALVRCATGGNFTISGSNGNTPPGNGNTDPGCKPVITSVSPLGQYVHWDYNCNANPVGFIIYGRCGGSGFGEIGPLASTPFPNNGALRLGDILVGIADTGSSQVCAVFPDGSKSCSNAGAPPCL